jgi:predicted nucleic-acid-binding Zn-ribbon protein
MNTRKCIRCQSDTVEGFDIKIEGGGYGIKITSTTGVFAKRIEKPKVAICPQCGEISLYIKNLDEVKDIEK